VAQSVGPEFKPQTTKKKKKMAVEERHVVIPAMRRQEFKARLSPVSKKPIASYVTQRSNMYKTIGLIPSTTPQKKGSELE
jgi:hypothetical protein